MKTKKTKKQITEERIFITEQMQRQLEELREIRHIRLQYRQMSNARINNNILIGSLWLIASWFIPYPNNMVLMLFSAVWCFLAINEIRNRND